MAEQPKQVNGNATLTKRYSTATVKAKILDTDQLNHMGLDMSQWRCKDLANFKFFKESAIDSCDVRNLNCVSPSTSDSSVITSTPSSPLPLKGFARLRSRFLKMSCSGSNTVKRSNSINTPSNQSKNSSEEFQSQTFVSTNLVTKVTKTDKYCQEKRGGKVKPSSEKQRRNYRESKFRNDGFSLTGHEDIVCFDNIVTSTSNKITANQSENSGGWLSFIHFSQGDANNIAKKDEVVRMSKLQTCNSCGKQFGTAGFKIHQSRCVQVRFNSFNSSQI